MSGQGAEVTGGRATEEGGSPARNDRGREQSGTGSGQGAEAEPALQVTELRKRYPLGRSMLPGGSGRAGVAAVDGVTLSVPTGRTLGLVGESGSGKSTLAKLLVAVERPTSGSISVLGTPLHGLSGRRLRRARRDIQLVFQDPYTSLDPRQTVADIVGEPLSVHPELVQRRQRGSRIRSLLDQVGLSPAMEERLPHQLSGGQRQRVGIARALALEPKILVLDEPVSALDTSVQAQIVNLLADLQAELGLTYVFIAHDLGVVAHLSDEIAVMYLGRIVEQGSYDAIFHRPAHPYTAALLSAVPEPDPARRAEFGRRLLPTEPPMATEKVSGCRFRNRCPRASEICRTDDPALDSSGHPGPQLVACHHPETVEHPTEQATEQRSDDSTVEAIAGPSTGVAGNG